jgi:hypothetical protein
VGKTRRRFADAIEAGRQLIGEPLGIRLTADEPAEHPDHLQNLADRALVERHDRDAAPNELRDEVGLQIGEGQHEIRPERLDLVEFRADERGYLRLLPRLRRPHGIARDTDDAIALPEEVQRLRRLLGEADDASWIIGHLVIWLIGQLID